LSTDASVLALESASLNWKRPLFGAPGVATYSQARAGEGHYRAIRDLVGMEDEEFDHR
jgi:hypothetical protein